jgi:hypothetical protein
MEPVEGPCPVEDHEHSRMVEDREPRRTVEDHERRRMEPVEGPPQLTCPECGRPRDPSEIILYGWGRGRRENISTARPSRLIWVFLTSSAWLIFSMLQAGTYRRYSPLLLLCIAASLLMYIILIFNRRSTTHPGLIQIRLNEREIVQYDSLAGPPVIWEILYSHGWLVVACIPIVLLFTFARGDTRPIQFWILFPLSAIVATSLWFRGRKFRRAIALVHDNAIADRNAAFNNPIRWSHIANVSLHHVKDDRYRLRVLNTRKFFEEFPIDAEVQCTEEQADQLNQWMNERLAAARKKAILEDLLPGPPAHSQPSNN